MLCTLLERIHNAQHILSVGGEVSILSSTYLFVLWHTYAQNVIMTASNTIVHNILPSDRCPNTASSALLNRVHISGVDRRYMTTKINAKVTKGNIRYNILLCIYEVQCCLQMLL